MNPSILILSILIILLFYLILRVYHLIASVFWIALRGGEWAESVKTLFEEGGPTIEEMEILFRDYGGTKLPWLFAGVKSIRIRNGIIKLKQRNHKVYANIAILCRALLWQYYLLPVWMAAVIIVIGSQDLTPLQQSLLLGLCVVLCIGSIVIAVEGAVSYLTMGSWSSLYHRFPNRNTYNWGAEILFGLGTAVFVLVPPVIATNYVSMFQFESSAEGSLSVLHALLLALTRTLEQVKSLNFDAPQPSSSVLEIIAHTATWGVLAGAAIYFICLTIRLPQALKK